MAGNTIGSLFRVTTFGESHGAAIGAVIDGCPAGIALTPKDFITDLQKRMPTAGFETQRKEADIPEILSGIFEGKTLGTPIAVLVRNTNTQPHDYEKIKHIFRPGHADFAYHAKYGHRDWRGGGRASGRETIGRVLAGTVAKKVIEYCTAHEQSRCISIETAAIEIAGIPCPPLHYSDPIPQIIEEKLMQLKHGGDSAGAVLQCRICHIPAGIGEPVFDKLDAELAKALLSIGSIKGITFGAGSKLARMTGSEANTLHENHNGGITGGITDGNSIVLQLIIKPVPSIAKKHTVYTSTGEVTEVCIGGRHDVCIYKRIIPVVEAMAAIVFADMMLRHKVNRI
ncbi:MAG: chorismate synthase [Treponema sp.]